MLPPVLFVDDSAVARAAATKLLVALGLRVTALASSREAADVDATAFGAALLDLELGDGLGTELARVLRARVPGLPIAFLTACAQAPALDEAQRFGPVFSKSDEVEAAVQWVANQAAGRGEPA
jgi:CheY-like chemotaxis protein